MVGPSPYRYASFAELRAVMGGAWLVCRPCRRFVPVGRWLDARDSRRTTFSCSVCGGDGDVVLEDPAKEGLQHDPRPTASTGDVPPAGHPPACQPVRPSGANPRGRSAARERCPTPTGGPGLPQGPAQYARARSEGTANTRVDSDQYAREPHF
jgi:hypothetical protein